MKVTRRLYPIALSAALLGGCSIQPITQPSQQTGKSSLTISPVQPAEPSKKERYKGPIAIAVDPDLLEDRASPMRSRRVLASEDNHNSSDNHHQRDQKLYFDPNDPASLAGINPNHGDSSINAGAQAYFTSGARMNDSSAAIAFISGQLIVRPRGSAEALFEKLGQKYEFQVGNRINDYYLLEFDLNQVSLTTLQTDLQDLNQLNEEPIQSITFSSINAAKMAGLLADVLVNFQDVVLCAEWNQVPRPSVPLAYEQNAVTPSDPRNPPWWFGWPFGINVEPAWSYSLGTGVRLAVVDSGFDAKYHPELKRQLERQQGFDFWGRPYPPGQNVEGLNPEHQDTPDHPSAWHGSLISMGADAERNNGIGMAGVAPNAKLWTINGGTSNFSEAAGIEFAAESGVEVILDSMGHFKNNWFLIGGMIDNTLLNGTVNEVLARHPNVVIVVAAGNDNRSVEDYILQSRKDVIVVGAVEFSYENGSNTNRRWIWPYSPANHNPSGTDSVYASNYGDNVDIWAPGDEMEGAHYRTTNALNGERHSYNGTSNAAPLVAGAVALIKSRNPGLTTSQMIEILRTTAKGAEPDGWTGGTKGGIPGTGGYVVRDGRNVLPMLQVDAAVAAAVDTTRWTLQRFQGHIIRPNATEERYELFQPNFGFYQKLLNSLPNGALNLFSQAEYVELRGWKTDGGELEVHSIKEIAPPSSSYLVSGTVTDHLGEPVPDLPLTIGQGEQSEGYTVTDSRGGYSFQIYEPGEYIIRPHGDQYIDIEIRTVVAGEGTVEISRNVVVSPPLNDNQTRIALSWSDSPADLDAHFTGPKVDGGRFHVFWDAKSYSDQSSNVTLDVDDRDGHGPETVSVTVTGHLPGTYRYAVHDYTNRESTNSRALTTSYALVYIYRGNRLLAEVAPTFNAEGTVWDVLEMDGNTGAIRINNVLRYESNPNYVIQSIDNPLDILNLIRNLPLKTK